VRVVGWDRSQRARGSAPCFTPKPRQRIQHPLRADGHSAPLGRHLLRASSLHLSSLPARHIKLTLRGDQVGFISGVCASPIQPHFINWSGKAPYNENLYHLREARFDVSDARGRSPAGGYASSLEALIGSWLVRCANAVTRAQRSHTRPKPKACTSTCVFGES
jgi:hypothetical protein